QLLKQTPRYTHELADELPHVHGDADSAGLIGQSPSHCLADPPGRVRRELVAPSVVELLNRAHQTGVALLDEVEERHPAADVLLGYGHNQAEVGLGELVARLVVAQ